MDLLNNLLNAVSVGINQYYPDVEIFPELVPNELPERCFLIGFAGDTTVEKSLDRRYRVSGSLSIDYLSPKMGTELLQEQNRVYLQLSLRLQVVRYQGLIIRLHRHQWQMTGDVLHILCDFSTFLYQLDPTPSIAAIQINRKMAEESKQ